LSEIDINLKKKLKKNLKIIGVGAFMFFLIKGIAWIIIFYLGYNAISNNF
tara:strand:- start:272 stop:421 length:150 start_codon:yes stop_codon:yes gene_type:complete